MKKNHERKRKSTNISVSAAIEVVDVGREIVERQGGAERAKYGDGLIRHLALKLTAEFGPGYDVANLRNMRQFYLVFEKRYTLCSELTWSLPAVEELQLELQRERTAIEEAQLLAMVDEPRKAKRLANLTKERWEEDAVGLYKKGKK